MHTPAPWNIEDNSIIADDGSHIASVTTINDFPCIEEDNDAEQLAMIKAECEANLSLIGTAPELLEALKDLVERFVKAAMLAGSSRDFVEIAVAKHRAVIAKAEVQ